MKINLKLKSIFDEFAIDYDEGILYLLSIFFHLKINEEKFEETIKKVNFAKIVERDYETKTVIWNTPLFEGTNVENNWDWVISWRNLFKDIRPDRAGTLNLCLTRMKQFFAKNPHVRREDVLKATQLYLETVTDSAYLTSAHYFIKKDKGTNEQSKLEEFIEIVLDRKKAISKNNVKGML